MGSCGTAVIKTWMRRRGCGLHSISYRSQGLSLLTDWLLGAARPFCKVHYIITLQKIILSTNTKSYTLHTPTGDTWTLEISWARGVGEQNNNAVERLYSDRMYVCIEHTHLSLLTMFLLPHVLKLCVKLCTTLCCFIFKLVEIPCHGWREGGFDVITTNWEIIIERHYAPVLCFLKTLIIIKLKDNQG